MKQVISRMAPSNTGSPTLGNARTLLLAHMTALQNNGETILRIESTDTKRSTEESTNEILDVLKYLNITYSPTVVDQKTQQDLGVYTDIANKLLTSGFAYYCKCTEDELKRMKLRQISQKSTRQGYEGDCRHCCHSDGVLRFNSAFAAKTFGLKKVTFEDKTYGYRSIDHRDIQDAVLLRKDGSATYMLANVIDDVLSGVTHITRGVDLLPQSFMQILLAKSIRRILRFKDIDIEYTHLPLIVSPEGKKLSKRDPSTPSVLSYKTKGYIPEALVQYICSLGNTSVTLDIPMSKDDLVRIYDSSKTNFGNVKVSEENLKAINKKHLQNLNVDSLRKHLETLGYNHSMFSDKLIDLYKTRSSTLVELYDKMLFVTAKLKENKEKTESLKLALTTMKLLDAYKLFQEFRQDVLQGQASVPLQDLLEAC